MKRHVKDSIVYVYVLLLLHPASTHQRNKTRTCKCVISVFSHWYSLNTQCYNSLFQYREVHVKREKGFCIPPSSDGGMILIITKIMKKAKSMDQAWAWAHSPATPTCEMKERKFSFKKCPQNNNDENVHRSIIFLHEDKSKTLVRIKNKDHSSIMDDNCST